MASSLQLEAKPMLMGHLQIARARYRRCTFTRARQMVLPKRVDPANRFCGNLPDCIE